MVDECCLQEVTWRGLGLRMLWIEGRRHRLWWSGNVVGGVGVMVKVVRHGSKEGDRVMATMLAFEEEMPRLICGYTPQSEECRKKGNHS